MGSSNNFSEVFLISVWEMHFFIQIERDFLEQGQNLYE